MAIKTVYLPSFPPGKMSKLANYVRDVLAGKREDEFGIAIRYWSAVAQSLFDSIFLAFVIKSNHGSDNLGNSWKDLSRNTKAYGRKDAREGLTLYDNRAVKTPSLKVRPTLPPNINKQWGGRWFGLFVYMRGDKQGAGASTWEHFKAKGYPTLRGFTRNMKLPILNRTGVLQRSLMPFPLQGGISVPNDPNQIFRYEAGRLEIGSRFPYIETLSKDRPVWPFKMRPWIDKAHEAGRDAMFEYLPTIVEKVVM